MLTDVFREGNTSYSKSDLSLRNCASKHLSGLLSTWVGTYEIEAVERHPRFQPGFGTQSKTVPGKIALF